jgi:hypothetical protein
LSPVEQSRELDPLDSVLDSEPQKHTVEIGLDGAFGHVQLTGDFGVVTSLEKQIDDLLFPASQPAELLVHALYLAATQGMPPRPGDKETPRAPDSGFCLPFLLQPRRQNRGAAS